MTTSGRSVLVTGASRGIGAAIARAFADNGDRVAVHYSSSADAAQEVLASLTGEGHVLAHADLRDPAAIRTMVDAVADQLGGIDVLVNNAGIFIAHPIEEVDYETWQQAWADTLAVNLVGAVERHLVRPAAHAAPRRLAHRERRLARGVPRRAAQPVLRREQGRHGGLRAVDRQVPRCPGHRGDHHRPWVRRDGHGHGRAREARATRSAGRAPSTGCPPPRRSPAPSCSSPPPRPSGRAAASWTSTAPATSASDEFTQMLGQICGFDPASARFCGSDPDPSSTPPRGLTTSRLEP